MREDAAPPPLDAEALPTLALEVLPFAEMAEALRAHDGVRADCHAQRRDGKLRAVVGGRPPRVSLLEMRARAAARGSAAGVSITMSLPLPAPTHLLHALVLNEAELQSDSPTDLLGGWVMREGALVHEAFVPQALCTGEMVRHMAEGAVRRAAWLRVPRVAPSSRATGRWTRAGRVIPFKRPS